ncbi:hypothetical protein FB451DRAFT_1392767 [Mycena latifolia]|nr:hypothetical protein FB451DRAFT_1392767 [Mycena latifolia]
MRAPPSPSPTTPGVFPRLACTARARCAASPRASLRLRRTASQRPSAADHHLPYTLSLCNFDYGLLPPHVHGRAERGLRRLCRVPPTPPLELELSYALPLIILPRLAAPAFPCGDYLPLLLSPSNSRTPSPASSTSSRLAALLSPPPLSAEAQAVPADVDAAGAAVAPRRPSSASSEAAPSPVPASPVPASPLEDGVEVAVDSQDAHPLSPPPLALPPYTGWHPRLHASQLHLTALAASTLPAAEAPSCAPSAFPASPQLRSCSCSSTLSSSSPSSSPSLSSSNPPPANSRARVHPIRSTSATVAGRMAKGGKKGKKLTVADVNVLVVGRPEGMERVGARVAGHLCGATAVPLAFFGALAGDARRSGLRTLRRPRQAPGSSHRVTPGKSTQIGLKSPNFLPFFALKSPKTEKDVTRHRPRGRDITEKRDIFRSFSL